MRKKEQPSAIRRFFIILLGALFAGLVYSFYSPAYAQTQTKSSSELAPLPRLTPEDIDKAYGELMLSLQQTEKHEVRRTYARLISQTIIVRELRNEKRRNIPADETTLRFTEVKALIDRILNTSCLEKVIEQEKNLHSLICLHVENPIAY